MGKRIVKYRYVILAVFAVLIIAALVLFPTMVNRVNYDLTSYLPDGYDTYDGYAFLSEHFNIHGDAEIGVYTDYDTVSGIAEAISDIEGVSNVIWADMLSYLTDAGLYAPDDPAFQKLYSILTDAPVGDLSGKHNWAILVTMIYPPSNPEAIDVFQQIKDLLAEKAGDGAYAMSGMTEQANALYETVFDELWMYCLVAAIVVLIILAFTTNSLMEPVILILTLGISIIINMGTNAIFPSTSMVTFACSAILQLGLSMDYAIFLLHQYRAELKLTPDPRRALANAVPKSAKAVTASALTTVGGFLALLCMKFEIGTDLGLTLAKGILCSLLTVIFLQPCLMLMMEKARVKTAHACIDVKAKAPVKRSIKYRNLIAAIFVIALIPACIGSNSLSYAYLKFMPPNEDTSVKQQMAKELGNQVMMIVPMYARTDAGLNDGAPLVEENFEFIERISDLGDEKISFSLGLGAMLPQDKQLSAKDMKDAITDAMREFDVPEEIKILFISVRPYETVNTAIDFLDEYGDGSVDNNIVLNNATLSLLFDSIKHISDEMLYVKPLLDALNNSTVVGKESLIGMINLMSELGGEENMISLPATDILLQNILGVSLSDILPVDMGMISQFISPNGYTMYTVGINPAIDNESKESFDILDEVKAIAADVFGDNGKCYFTGYVQAAYDFAAITPGDFMLVTLVSIAVILVILVIALSGIKLPVILVALIELGIWLNLLLQYVFAGGTINFMSYLVISAVQLGATVDYAILVSTKFKELRKRFEPRQAAYIASTKSTMSVITSALIMSGACFSVYFITSNLIVKEMTFLMARGALISAALVILVLPALLAALDRTKGGELHIMRTQTLSSHRRPTKAMRAAYSEPLFGEIVPPAQEFSGTEIYEMLHDGIDITDKKQIKKWIKRK